MKIHRKVAENTKPRTRRAAFTMVEIALAVAVIAACVALGSPWVPASSLLSAGAAEFGLGQGIAFALWNLAWGAGQAVGAAGGAALAHATADAVPYVALAIACLATVFAVRIPFPESDGLTRRSAREPVRSSSGDG